MKKLLLLLFIVGLLSSCASFKQQSGYIQKNSDWKIRKL